MSFPRSLRVALGCFFLIGCKGGSGTPAQTGPRDAGVLPMAALSFDITLGEACADGGLHEICLAPSQTVTFTIHGSIDGPVSVALEGTYADAALTTEQVLVVGGSADVTLQAASVPVSFSVVARDLNAANAPAARVPVVVSQAGTAAVVVNPSYAGHRPTPTFFATRYALASCTEIAAAALNPDAGVPWTSAPDGISIDLSINAGEHTAIDVRVGHYASGCADVPPLVPSTTSTPVPVQLFDVPMALDATNLTATFTPDGTGQSDWKAISVAAGTRIAGGFFDGAGTATWDASALLDAMRATLATAADQSQFTALRTSGGWDALAATWLSARMPGLQARALTWLALAENGGPGALVIHIGNGGNGTAPVTVTTLGGLTAANAGVAPPAPFQWTADANDAVHLSGAIDLTTTPLIAHAADAKAALQVASATDVPSAIAAGIDCAGLAKTLVGTGVSYGTCDAACTGATCASALTQVWATAALPRADGSDAIHTTITASAPADVGDLAEPSYLEGGWLGNVSGAAVAGGVSFSIAGDLIAIEPNGFTP